jgi:hypothetical protein
VSASELIVLMSAPSPLADARRGAANLAACPRRRQLSPEAIVMPAPSSTASLAAGRLAYHGSSMGDTMNTTNSQRSAARFKASCQRSPALSPRSGSRSRNTSSQPWAVIQSRMAMASALFFKHGVEPYCLLGFVAGVDRCLLYERVELHICRDDGREPHYGGWPHRSHQPLVGVTSTTRSDRPQQGGRGAAPIRPCNVRPPACAWRTDQPVGPAGASKVAGCIQQLL